MRVNTGRCAALHRAQKIQKKDMCYLAKRRVLPCEMKCMVVQGDKNSLLFKGMLTNTTFGTWYLLFCTVAMQKQKALNVPKNKLLACASKQAAAPRHMLRPRAQPDPNAARLRDNFGGLLHKD